MIPDLHFLTDKLKVVPAKNNQVKVTVTIPADFLFQYAQLLDSLSGFVEVLKKQENITRLNDKSTRKLREEKAKKTLDAYYKRLVKAYDLHISQGMDRNSAIKQISADLRASGHSWCSIELVRPSLIKAGRSGRVGRPRGKK